MFPRSLWRHRRSPFFMAELFGARVILFSLEMFSLLRGCSAQQADDAARERGPLAGDVSDRRFGWAWSCRSPRVVSSMCLGNDGTEGRKLLT